MVPWAKIQRSSQHSQNHTIGNEIMCQRTKNTFVTLLNWSMIDKFDPSSIWEQSIARCPEQKFTWVHNEAKMKKIGMKAGAREPKIIKLSNFCFSDRTRHNQFSVLLIAKLLISFVISFSWVRLVPKLYSAHVLCYNKSAVLELVVTTDSSNDH